MSYDIRFGVRVYDSDAYAVIGEPEYPDPTYNLGNMFRAAMGWNFQQGEWYRLVDVLPHIKKGVFELSKDPGGKYTAMNPPNGWGRREDAINVLAGILSFVDTGLTFGDNAEIPKTSIYIRW